MGSYISSSNSQYAMRFEIKTTGNRVIMLGYMLINGESTAVLKVDVQLKKGSLGPEKYDMRLVGFYNYLQTDYKSVYDQMTPAEKAKIKGIGYSALCYLFQYLSNKGIIKPTDEVYLEASGSLYQNGKTLVDLHNYYASMGFRVIFPGYLRRFMEATAKYEKGELTSDDLERQNNELIDKWNSGSIYPNDFAWSYMDISYIPMSATVSTIVGNCGNRSKRISKPVIIE